MPDAAILAQHAGAIATITLNRPDRRNALTPAMLDELAAALDRAENDPAVRAVVLAGAGKGFCAGQDLAALGDDIQPAAILSLLLNHYKPVILRLVELPKPVIAAVNGVAAGAGAALALACDLRVMAADASLLQAFINVGLIPDAGSTYLLARQVGYSRALELAVSGERLPAARCLELGLANRVAPADELWGAAQAWAAELAQKPTVAVGLTKRLLHDSFTHDLATMIDREATAQARAVATADHREGVDAFLAKRSPVFQGR